MYNIRIMHTEFFCYKYCTVLYSRLIERNSKSEKNTNFYIRKSSIILHSNYVNFFYGNFNIKSQSFTRIFHSGNLKVQLMPYLKKKKEKREKRKPIAKLEITDNFIRYTNYNVSK